MTGYVADLISLDWTLLLGAISYSTRTQTDATLNLEMSMVVCSSSSGRDLV